MKARVPANRSRLSRLATLCVAVTIALSLVLATGSRHAAMASFAEAQAQQIAQFLSIGGSLEDLCQDDRLPHLESGDCDACRLTSLAALPAAPDAPDALPTRVSPFEPAPIAGPPGAAPPNPAAPVRGPPAIA